MLSWPDRRKITWNVRCEGVLTCHLSHSGGETACGRMRRPHRLSLLFVGQRPLLRLVCAGGTVSHSGQMPFRIKKLRLPTFCLHSRTICNLSVTFQVWPALGMPTRICAGSLAVEFQPDAAVPQYSAAQPLQHQPRRENRRKNGNRLEKQRSQNST